MQLALIALLAALGGAIRYVAGNSIEALAMVNLTGSLLYAIILNWPALGVAPNRDGAIWRTAGVVGFCGSLTTFSGFFQVGASEWPKDGVLLMVSVVAPISVSGITRALMRHSLSRARHTALAEQAECHQQQP